MPGGNSTCGSTVHPVGGPAIRQAGEVYRNDPAWCKLAQANLDIWVGALPSCVCSAVVAPTMRRSACRDWDSHAMMVTLQAPD